jgi:hypothetical protein
VIAAAWLNAQPAIGWGEWTIYALLLVAVTLAGCLCEWWLREGEGEEERADRHPKTRGKWGVFCEKHAKTSALITTPKVSADAGEQVHERDSVVDAARRAALRREVTRIVKLDRERALQEREREREQQREGKS